MSLWQPLLCGDEAVDARQVARQIADDIAGFFLGRDGGAKCLPSEWADYALMFGYAARVLGDSRYEELSWKCRELATENLETLGNRLQLYGGLTGIGWAENHLRTLMDDEPLSNQEADEQFEELDLKIAASLESGWPRDYDLIAGWAGIAIYLLERLPSPRTRGVLARLIEQFEHQAERLDAGVRWLTPPALIAESQRRFAPRGYYNLGLAHGIPGLLVVLAEMTIAGIAPEQTRALVAGGVSFLLAQESRNPALGSSFSDWMCDAQRPSTPPLIRWCYYDLGVAIALLGIGRLMKEPAWVEAARRVLERCSAVNNPEAGIVDAGLCHGAFGAAHLFNRAYQALAAPALRDAALRWYRVGRAMQRSDGKFGGFRVYRQSSQSGRTTIDSWEDSPSFLNGSAGICLALLAAASDLEPKWDHRMLVTLS